MVFLALILTCEDSWAVRTLSGKVAFQYGILSFQIHGPASALPTMNWLKKMLEQNPNTRKLLNYFAYAPESDIHFFVDEKAKQANGLASFFPYNTITLFDYPPLDWGELSAGHQWFQLLVLHELTHIIHTDQVGGVFRLLRTLFGSSIKPGVLIPRWISEGIAVWAESQFTHFGRLRSTLLKRELYRKLRSPFCHHIGCLDSPGKYPFGSYPYWTGGFFMDFLERKKTGTIRCFIKRNSARLPFFTNAVFDACAGQGAESLFAQFRIEFLKQYEKEFFNSGEAVSLPHQDQISWFRGTVLQGTVLYYIFWHEQEQFVGAYDFATQKWRSYAVADPIKHLYLSNQSIWLKTYVGLDERGKKRTYQLQGEQFVPVSDQSAEYVFQMGARKVFFHYQSLQWTISNTRGRQWKLPPGYGIFRPELLMGKIFFKLLREFDEVAQVVELDPATLAIKKYGESRSGNTFWGGSCGGKVYLLDGTHGQNRLLQLGGSTLWASQQVARMIFVRFSQQGVFVLEKGGPRFYSQSCGQYLQQLKGQQRLKNSSPIKLDLARNIRYQKPSRSDSYPVFQHFLPQYWYLSYSLSDDWEQGGIRTQLVDPKGNHNIRLKADYYTQNQHWGPQVSYTYHPRYFFWGAKYQKTFSPANEFQEVNEQEQAGVFIGHRLLGESWSYLPKLSLTKGKKIDFLSTRKSHHYTFDQTWILLKKRRYQLLDRFYLKNSLSYVKFKQVLSSRLPMMANLDTGEAVASLKPYWAWQISSYLGLNFNQRWRSQFRLGYSRFFKTDLVGGAVFGGGNNGDALQSYHNFHGLGDSDIYGNTTHIWGIQYLSSLGHTLPSIRIYSLTMARDRGDRRNRLCDR